MDTEKFSHKFTVVKRKLEHLACSLVIRTALITAMVMPFVRATHNAQTAAFYVIEDTVKVATEKLARALQKALRAATLSSHIQNVSPSVPNWDHNIRKACITFRRLLEATFIELTFLILTLFAICIPFVYATLGAVGIPIAVFIIDDTICASMETNQTNPFIEHSQTANVKLPAKICSNVSGIATKAAYAILSVLCIPFMIPAYMFGSTFGLANKFNIYDYNKAHSSGIVHKHLNDIHSCTVFTTTPDNQLLYQEAHRGRPSICLDYIAVARAQPNTPDR